MEILIGVIGIALVALAFMGNGTHSTMVSLVSSGIGLIVLAFTGNKKEHPGKCPNCGLVDHARNVQLPNGEWNLGI